VLGKGRQERGTPLSKPTMAVVQAWLCEPARGETHILCPNARGGCLRADGVPDILAQQTAVACQTCPSLRQQRVAPHVLRLTTAMEL